MDICRAVVVKCVDTTRFEAITFPVSTGMRTRDGNCVVSLCIPNPCVPGLRTRFITAKLYEYKIEYSEDDVFIYEYNDDKIREIYAYPRNVWEKVEKLYLKPLQSGKTISEHILLMGAPGTGKTVMVKLLSNMLGINLSVIRVTDIKSKYYGETEKNLEKRLNDSIRLEPNIVLIDDAEFLLSSRSMVSSYSSSTDVTEISLRGMLFSFLERVIDEGKRVLVCATTNVSPSAIDEAFIRGMRFGEPIFIPLPSYNALYTYAKFRLGDDKRARELAHRCVVRGLTIADLKAMIRFMENNLEPDFRRLGGRGYARLHSIPVDEIVESKVLREKVSSLFSMDKDRPTTMYMKTTLEVGLPIIAQILMNLRRPGMILTDPRYVDEFSYSVESQKAIGVVPTTLPPDIGMYVRINTRQPIIFICKKPPEIESYVLFFKLDELINLLGNKISVLVKAIAVYYNIPYKNEDLEKCDRIWRGGKVSAESFLSAICNTGKINDEVLGRVMINY